MPRASLSDIAEPVVKRASLDEIEGLATPATGASAPKPYTPQGPQLPQEFTYDLNLDEQGVPLPVVSPEGLARKYSAPVEKTEPVKPQGPGLKDVEIGARQGAVGLVRHYADPAAKLYGGRLRSGRTLGEAAEEYLGPNPEDVEARQGTASKIIQGASRAPFDIAPYALAPGNPAAGMAGVDAFRATGDPEAGVREIAGAGSHGAVMGAALGPLGKYRRAVRVPVAGVGLGAIPAAMEGAGTSDIVASGVVMGGLSGLHGARPQPPELAEPRPQTPLEWAKEQDYSARLERPRTVATPGAPLGEAPKMPLDRLMEREGVPVERETTADAEWWKGQPETRVEREAGYADLFDQAERLEARRARKVPEIPETGIPEGVARGVDARERIARQTAGKSWEELTPSERLVVDDLIAEGHVGAGGAPEPARPPKLETPSRPAPVERKTAPISEIAEKVLTEELKPAPESKPYVLTPEEQAALRSQNAPKDTKGEYGTTASDVVDSPVRGGIRVQPERKLDAVAPDAATPASVLPEQRAGEAGAVGESVRVNQPVAQDAVAQAGGVSGAGAAVEPWRLTDPEFREWSAKHGKAPKGDDIVYKTKARAIEAMGNAPDKQYATAVPFHSQGVHGWVIRPTKEYYKAAAAKRTLESAKPSSPPVRTEPIPEKPVVARTARSGRENAPGQRILQGKGEPEPPALAEINARVAEKTASPMPWAKAVTEHGQAEKRFVELLQSKKPDAKALAEAAAEVDRLAEPLKGQIGGPTGYALTAKEIAEVYGKTPSGRAIREKTVDVDAIRDRNAAEFMEYHKRAAEPEIPAPEPVEATPPALKTPELPDSRIHGKREVGISSATDASPDVMLETHLPQASYLDAVRRHLQRYQDRNAPAFAVGDMLYTRDGLYKVEGDRTIKEHDLSATGWKTTLERNLDESGKYSSHNRAALEEFQKLKAEQRRIADEQAAAVAASREQQRIAGEKEAARRKQIDDELAGVKFQKANVSVVIDGEGKKTDLQAPSIDGLAVHRMLDMDGKPKAKGFAVTHIQSGLRVFDADTMKDARVAAFRLSKITDWTKPAGDLKKLGEQAIGPVREMRLNGVYASFPEARVNPEVAAAKARIKGRLKELATSEKGEQSFQLDPRDLEDLVLIGSDYVKTVGRSLEKWSDAMIAEFGDVVKPYLLSIYTKSVRRTIEAPPEPPPMGTPGQTPRKPVVSERDRLNTPGLSLVEGGKQTVNGPKVIQFPARGNGERGAFSLKPTGPQTPSEVYAKEMVAKREAARKGPVRDMVDRIRLALTKAKAEGVDSTAPILDAIHKAQKEHGYELRPSENIEHQIDRVYRSRSIADQFMQDNKLLDAIRSVDDIDYFDQYLIAKQALDVEAHGFKTGRDLARDRQLVRDFQKRYAGVEKVIREYDRKLLDYSVDAGLISRELADHLQQIYTDYVPLNRVFNALEKTDLGRLSRGRGVASLSRQTVVERLMGSEREIENPLASFIDKTYRAFQQGERNKAARMLAGYRDLPGMKGLIVETAPGAITPDHLSFSYLDGGTKRTFETTKEIAAAAKSLDVRDIGLLGRIFAAPARLMKTGTTGINLPFVLSNVAVDQVFTMITSRYDRSLANPITFVRALTSALKHDKLWDEMVREGGGFTSFDISRNQPKQTIDRIRAGRDTESRLRYAVEHPVSTVAELFRATEDAVSRSEQFGRMRLYESAKQAALKQGRTEADARIIAAQHANNALPNYLRAGSMMRPLNAAVPYLNAGVQGSRAFLRAMAENPGRTSASVATTLFFPVAMATMWNLSDPERKRAYADIQDYEKENNLVILIPGQPSRDKQGRYKVIKIKLPPGLNKLASPVRRFLEQAEGLDPVRFGEMAEAAIGTVSPVEPNMSGLSNIIPQAIKPSVQAVANYDFFRGRPKVPGKLQDQPKAMQVQPYTSGTARKIAGALRASPIKTEEFIKDTLGGVGSQVLNVSDRALATAGAIPKEQIGGTSIMEAVTARFNTARGGELENREYAKRKEIEETAIARAVEQAKRTPFYARLDSEDKRQRHLQTVANRARYQVSKVTDAPRYRRLEPDQRIAELERAAERIARMRVPARVTRPSPPRLTRPRPFEARN